MFVIPVFLLAVSLSINLATSLEDQILGAHPHLRWSL